MIVVKRETDRDVIAELADNNLITGTTAGDYLVRKQRGGLQGKKDTALHAWEKFAHKGSRVNLALVNQLTLIFKNGEKLVFDSKDVSFLILEKDLDNPTLLTGFVLVLNRELSVQANHYFVGGRDAFEHLKKVQDIIDIELTDSQNNISRHIVHWSPISDPLVENVNQRFVDIDDALFLYAVSNQRYSMVDAVKAALYTENFNAIIKEFRSKRPESSLTDSRHEFTVQLEEMLQAVSTDQSQAQRRLEDELLVDKVHTDSDQTFFDHWEPVLYHLKSKEKFLGIDLLSYDVLMMMNVVIPEGDFWKGFTWLLWEISRYGIKTAERQKAIDNAKQKLQEQTDQISEFTKSTQRMRDFISWYVNNHLSDPTLPDFVEKYWPLTKGRKEKFWNNGGHAFVMEQNPKLLNEFMANFGADYYQFKDVDTD
ncbi:hypothetical protein [Lentilactobacillus hilgardii]|uniref:hypothetical protein n=1 Tax=Lentilactobacillus hilgardii TaxID=1588 RepID=UPI000301F9D0|nr:hypothetical protein [Lentilactobacillus hilgardii]KRK59202.1 hypothetical protein FD42_GL000892 [Lentilactobacillus hilgardii DSM 20176 = ATCC 8290]TDG86047.1 hypothetical protein C5L34_002208 [Lentilactobacillus hilgardii]